MNNHWEIRPATQFEQFADRWDTLNLACGGSPLLSADFAICCLNNLSSGKELLAWRESADGTVDIAAIIAPQGWLRSGVFQPSQAPLGFWIQSPEVSTEQATRELTKSLPGQNLVFSITQQDPSILAPPAPTTRLQIASYIPTARITIDEPWENYWKSRSKNLRQNHRKAYNRAQKQSLDISFISFGNPAQISDAIETYGEIESRSWKAAGGTAVNKNNQQGIFYVELLSKFAATGQAQVHCVLIGGKPAAMDLCLYASDSLIVLKTTFDDQFKEFSPASILREHYFEQAYENNSASKIEFYGRVMDWHKRLTNDIREIYHLTYFRSSFFPAVRQLAGKFSQARKQSE